MRGGEAGQRQLEVAVVRFADLVPPASWDQTLLIGDLYYMDQLLAF